MLLNRINNNKNNNVFNVLKLLAPVIKCLFYKTVLISWFLSPFFLKRYYLSLKKISAFLFYLLKR